MLRLAKTGALTAMAWTCPALAQLPCSYEVMMVPPFNSCFGGNPVPGTPTAINNLGHVLLVRTQCAEGYDDTYIWTGGATATLIPRPPGMLGFTGTDLNDNGLVCGEAWYESPVGLRGLIYNTNTGQWTILPPLNPPLGWSSVSAINNSNEACGYRSIGSPEAPHVPHMAFRWSAEDGFTDFGVMNGPNSLATDITEDGVVVGWTGSTVISNGTRAFVHASRITSVLPPIPGGSTSAALGAYSASRVAVYGMTVVKGVNVPRGFAYFDGAFIPLGVLPGYIRTFPLEVDHVGQVFGYCTSATFDRQPFIWRDGAMVDLNSLITTPGVDLSDVRAISAPGSIVGNGQLFGNNRAFVLTPVMPAPGDANCDGQVDVNDLLQVVTTWGPCAGCRGDLDGNSIVNALDLAEVMLHWSR